MKWCKGCQKVLSESICPTCGERGVTTQTIFRNLDTSQYRRVSTITEEDPHNDDLNRVNENADI